jgi:hypothetical protein
MFIFRVRDKDSNRLLKNLGFHVGLGESNTVPVMYKCLLVGVDGAVFDCLLRILGRKGAEVAWLVALAILRFWVDRYL